MKTPPPSLSRKPRSAITVCREPYSASAVDPINDGLTAFNWAHIGPYRHDPIVVVARDAERNVIGGAIGEQVSDWLSIQSLWVSEPNRRHGIGSTLLAHMEATAISQGARRAIVDTVEFQAPEFYRLHNYVEFGRIRNFVNQWDRVFFEKVLVK